MARLKPAMIAAAITIAAVMVLVLFRGFVMGAWIPWGAAIFIAITLGIVAAVVVASMPGDGRKEADKPVSPRVIPGWEARQPIAATAGFAPRNTSTAPVWIEPARTAIVFLQQMPPAYDPRHLSYFGGLPTVPRSFIWPTWTHEGATEPLHFVMQIDCAAVPASARHEAFPERGVLYFFLDLRWGHSYGFRVLYADDAADAFGTARAPAGLTAAYGYEARFAWRWMEALDEAEAPLPNCCRNGRLIHWPLRFLRKQSRTGAARSIRNRNTPFFGGRNCGPWTASCSKPRKREEALHVSAKRRPRRPA